MVVAIAIAVIKLRIYKYLYTPYLLVIALAFVFFAIMRVLIALDELKIFNFSATLSREVTGLGYLAILIGSIGLLVFVKKAFIEAALLLKEKGIPLPDTWKDLDKRVEELKAKSDTKLNGDKHAK